MHTLPACLQIANRDVTDDAVPLAALLRHDFWGQDIRSAQSHKSYRPLTVLLFRCTRKAWAALRRAAPRVAAAAPDPPPAGDEGEGNTQRARAAGLHPFPFHAVSILLHAAASVGVLHLAHRLLLRLQPPATPAAAAAAAAAAATPALPRALPLPPAPAASSASPPPLPGEEPVPPAQPAPAAPSPKPADGHPGLRRRTRFADRPAAAAPPAAGGAGGGGGGAVAAAPETDAIAPHEPTPAPPSWAEEQALGAALLFALHPVHTEAVAGVVGQAELLCACLFVPALTLYCAAADGAAAGAAAVPLARPRGGGGGGGGAASHWALVAAALLLAGASCLAKEIGVTAMGAMAAYDLLLVAPGRHPLRQLGRLAAAAGGVGAYVAARRWVAGEHLVRIYRKVENPIPFADAPATRALTTAFLHARYAGLLLWPAALSADWSFECIRMVERWTDPRNATSATLYGALVAAVVAAGVPRRAVRLLRAWRAGGAGGINPAASAPPAGGAGDRAARWRLFVVAGLLVAPFLPASNVFFYVGTFIGERLLYVPSIGACLLAAHLVGQLAGSCSAAATGRGRRRRRGAAVALAAAAVLGACAVRTAVRNRDWASEEALFGAALRVCPDSAKVRLNAGILARRNQDYDAALSHFRRAQAIEPGYCEPTYWIGLTLINRGAVREGLGDLRAALRCKYVAADALGALNKLHLALMEHPHTVAQGGDAGRAAVLSEWAGVLAAPEVGRPGEACVAYEDVALALALQPSARGRSVVAVLDACDAALAERVDAPQASAAAAAAAAVDSLAARPGGGDGVLARVPAAALRACVAARRRLYRALARAGGDAGRPAVLREAYRYVSGLGAGPGCRVGSAGGGSPHHRLLHRVQSAHPEDPWLQLEWAETLAALGRAKEAAPHAEVAATMLRAAALWRALGARAPEPLAHIAERTASLVGGPGVELGAEEALRGGVRASELLAALLTEMREGGGERATTAAGGSSGACIALATACQLRGVLARVEGAGSDASGGEAPAAAAAAAAAHACLRRLQEMPACAGHVAAAAAALPPPAGVNE